MPQLPPGSLEVSLQKYVDDKDSDPVPHIVDAALQTHADLQALVGQVQSVSRLAGLTNRVYRLQSGKGDFVLRLPRDENAGLIDRRTEAHNLAHAADLGIAVAPLYLDPDTGTLLTGAVPLTGSQREPQPEALGRVIGRLHRSNASFQGRIDPASLVGRQRHELEAQPQLLREFAPLAGVLNDFNETAPVSGMEALVPSHGDLSPGNVLTSPDGLVLIDWEYSGLAHPSWDLAYAILEHGYSETQERAFLEAYLADGQNLEALCLAVHLMKIYCDAVSGLWALRQSASANDATDFVTFARARIERALAFHSRLSGRD